MRLAGKVAVITGAGSGMGRASARLFAKEGARILATDIDVQSGEETVKLIRKDKGEAVFLKVDVSKVADNKLMIDTAVKTFGKLDILYNNAGKIAPRGGTQIEESVWDETLAIHAKGPFFACKYAIPEMRKAGGGCILFTSAITALIGSFLGGPYSMAKGSIVILTKSLAYELGKDNIRVNCICPGGIETGMFKGGGEQAKEAMQHIVDQTPLRRMGTAEETAYAALFLCSDESSFLTGVALPVDGGFSLC